MAVAAEAKRELYGIQARKLLPPGRAWTVRDGTLFDQLLVALFSELANADERAIEALLEADPRTTSELLPDWERVMGLPGPCGNAAASDPERAALVTFQLASQGGQSPGYFVEVAAFLGFVVTVEEFRPTRADEAQAGCELIEDELCIFVWTIHAPEQTPTFFTAGESGAGEALHTVDVSTFECVLSDIRPAHTRLFFEYDLAYTGYGPWEDLFPSAAALELVGPPVLVSKG